MRLLAGISSLWRNLLRRGRVERELSEETHAYLRLLIDKNLEQGLNPAEARREALIQFGGLAQVKQMVREARAGHQLETIWQDLRYSARLLAKAPVFTAVALFSLALGIGGNTAIFSLIDAMLLRSLPVKDPQQLVLFSVVRPRGNDYTLSYPLIERLSQASHSFAGIVAANARRDDMRMSVAEQGADGPIESVRAEQVSGNYFSVLGVSAVAGRTMTEEDDRASAPQPVAVISYAFWERRFGADAGVIGRRIILDNSPFTIIGVAQPGFSGVEVGANPDLWWPLQMTPLVYPDRKWLNSSSSSWLLVMGRLRPGSSLAQARAEVDTLYHQQLIDIPPDRLSMLTQAERSSYLERRIELEPAASGWMPLRKQFRQPLEILIIVVGLVLLIACANVANLLLARTAARRKEIGMRLALGAGRFRLIRQLLTESVLLAMAGGALGLLFAYQGARVLLAYLPQQRPVLLDIRPGARVLGFTIAVSVLTGILFGLAPAMRSTRLDLGTSLKETVRHAGPGRSWLTLNEVLITMQVALSLFLLIGAGLFVRSLQKLKSLDAGFSRENVVVFSVDPGPGLNVAQQVMIYKQVLTRLEALPGARAVSVSARPPLNSGAAPSSNAVKVPGYTPAADQDTSSQVLWVGPKFFETMGIPVLQGRDFGPQDETPAGSAGKLDVVKRGTADKPLSVLINQEMGRHFFGSEDPLGKQFDFLDGSLHAISLRVIGVVKDSKYKSLRETTRRAFYISYFQDPALGPLTFLVRTAGNTASMGGAIQRVVRDLDPGLEVLGLTTLDGIVDESLVQERFVAQLSSFFSLFALMLACVGLYGVMSYEVTRRTSEIGIRMALGARSGSVVGLVMKEKMRFVAAGLAIGLVAAVPATRLTSSLLFGLAPNDPVTMSTAALVLVAVAAVAAYLPARRAARVDPLVALRHE